MYVLAETPLINVLMSMRDWVDTHDYRLRVNVQTVAALFKLPHAAVERVAHAVDKTCRVDSSDPESLEKFVHEVLYERDWTDYAL